MTVDELLKKWAEEYSCDIFKQEAFIDGAKRILRLNHGDIESLRLQIFIKGEQCRDNHRDRISLAADYNCSDNRIIQQ